jgi:hypothetical protein
MTWKDQPFIADVVVINLIQNMVASNVISWPTNADVKCNTIVKIHKYIGFHEGHHFIMMVMEVHGAPMHDMDRFIKDCAHLSYDRWLGGHLSLSCCIQFFRQHVSIALQRALTSVIKRKIAFGKWCLF